MNSQIILRNIITNIVLSSRPTKKDQSNRFPIYPPIFIKMQFAALLAVALPLVAAMPQVSPRT